MYNVTVGWFIYQPHQTWQPMPPNYAFEVLTYGGSSRYMERYGYGLVA